MNSTSSTNKTSTTTTTTTTTTANTLSEDSPAVNDGGHRAPRIQLCPTHGKLRALHFHHITTVSQALDGDL